MCPPFFSAHVNAGRTGIGDASGFTAGTGGSPYGCPAVPGYGVDVQR